MHLLDSFVLLPTHVLLESNHSPPNQTHKDPFQITRPSYLELTATDSLTSSLSSLPSKHIYIYISVLLHRCTLLQSFFLHPPPLSLSCFSFIPPPTCILVWCVCIVDICGFYVFVCFGSNCHCGDSLSIQHWYVMVFAVRTFFTVVCPMLALNLCMCLG